MKTALEQNAAFEAIHRIYGLPGGFVEDHPCRKVHNIYFDTMALKNYWDHVDGVYSRSKYRFRWYGDFLETQVQGYFEIKRKIGNLSTKRRSDLVNLNLTEGIAFPSDMLLQPILYNSFLRYYFVNFEKSIRMTVDEQLTFDYLPCGFFSIPNKPPAGPSAVIEIKTSLQPEDIQLAQVIERIPRLQKFSKYIFGVAELKLV